MTRIFGLKRFGRHFPVLLLLALAPVMADRLAHIDWRGVMRTAQATGAADWALALIATAISFWAVARHERASQRTLGLGGDAALCGATSIAISQSTGFGPMVGTLVRWRLRPDLGAAGAARLTTAVTLCFLSGWGVVTALAVTLSPQALPGPPIAMAALAATALIVGLSIWAPRRLRGRVPPVRALGAVVFYCALDTVAAAGALWVLLPDEADIGFALLLPAFLLALGAGLLSGAPGGVGPFELTLLALLPQLPDAPLLSGVLAWRAVYYALPLMIGGVIWLRGPRRPGAPRWTTTPPQALSTAQQRQIQTADMAEAQLLFQGPFALLQDRDHAATWIAARSGQSLILLGDPLHGPPGRALSLARDAARDQARAVAIYKCSPRFAARARAAGYRVLPIADEAVLNPSGFDLAGPGCRQLRRKLRKAAKSGLRCAPARQLPLSAMQRISDDWIARQGGECGFSTGRFDPSTLPRQRVFLAWQDDRLIGFASFHQTAREWVLDLMRLCPDAPDGAMHALIATALESAAQQGTPRMSLAAVPCPATALPGALRPLARHLAQRRAGLKQFKTAFAPRWERRYLVAPGALGIGLGLLDLWREITDPRGPARHWSGHIRIAPKPGSWHPSGDVSAGPVAVPATERTDHDRRADPPF